jgi:hypothetical protein
MRNKFYSAILSTGILMLTVARFAAAQGLPAMGPPIPTTIVVTKPAPDQTYGGKTTVTMGIGGANYKFILKDGYTNHPKIRWPDIWQYVNQSNPNFVVQGEGAQTFAKIKPGETLKVFGMFAPLNRTFEVLSVDQSGGDEKRY